MLLLHHIEELHFIRDILSTVHCLLILKRFLDVHFLLKLYLLWVGIPSFLHFYQNIVLVIVVVDIDLDAVFVVCAGKHEFPCKDLLFCQVFTLALLQFFDSVCISRLFGSYLSVFIVFSEEEEFGDTLQIITVLQKPTKESLRTMVSLLPRKGV